MENVGKNTYIKNVFWMEQNFLLKTHVNFSFFFVKFVIDSQYKGHKKDVILKKCIINK